MWSVSRLLVPSSTPRIYLPSQSSHEHTEADFEPPPPRAAAQDTPLLPQAPFTPNPCTSASARQRPAAQRAHSRAPFCTAHASLCCRWHPAAGGHVPWCGLGRRHCQSTRTSAQLRFTLTTPATLTPQPLTDARPQRTEPQLNQRRRAPA